jgi:hypothetical protein
MKYSGRYTSGGGDHDPRQRTWVKYECEDCGHGEAFDKTVQIRTGTFQQDNFGDSLKCSDCGSYGQSDEAREQQLKDKLEELTKTKSNIEIQMELIINQLSEMGIEDEEENLFKEKSLLWAD